jgi:hypothetical protein
MTSGTQPFENLANTVAVPIGTTSARASLPDFSNYDAAVRIHNASAYLVFTALAMRRASATVSAAGRRGIRRAPL